MSGVTAPDALAVACFRCGASVGMPCQPSWIQAPHQVRADAAREAAERAAILGPTTRPDSAWLELAEIWRGVGEADHAAILAVVKVRQAMPAGIDELVAVFNAGAVKHNGGNLGIAPGVTADDCAEHLIDHGHRLLTYGPESRDAETRRMDAAHAAARGVMVAQLVKGRR